MPRMRIGPASVQAHAGAAGVKARQRRAGTKAGPLQTRIDAEDAHRYTRYQRTKWKNTGAAKHNGATRSSRPTAPVTELRLPQ